MSKNLFTGVLFLSLTATAGFMASPPVLATTNTGKIDYIAGANASLAYVSIVNPVNGYAACAPQNRYVIDLSSVGGKSMYTIALTAKATGQPVTIVGSGACTAQPNDAEDVLNVITGW